MSLRTMTAQYIGGTLYLPTLEREVSCIIVREYDMRDWEYFKPMWAGCDNCAALNRAAGNWAKADAERRNRDESIHNLIKLLDKRQARIKALESLVRDMYGAWCATIDDYYAQNIDGYYERMTELGIEVRE